MEITLPLRIFSDLHLAHPASRVKNVWQLEPLIEGARTVVFNGDTVELRMRGILPTALRYRETLEALCAEKAVRPVFLNGNHDPTSGPDEHFELSSHGLLAFHGDALFPGITPWNRDGKRLRQIHEAALDEVRTEGEYTLKRRLVACRNATLEGASKEPKLGNRSQWFGGVLRDVMNARRVLAIFHAWTVAPGRAEKLLAEFRPDFRFAVFGHTHWPGVWERNGRVIMNTGAFFPWPGQGIVEVDATEIRYRKVGRDGKYFRLGKTVRRFQR